LHEASLRKFFNDKVDEVIRVDRTAEIISQIGSLTTLAILIVPAEVVGALRKSHAKNNQFQKPSNNL